FPVSLMIKTVRTLFTKVGFLCSEKTVWVNEQYAGSPDRRCLAGKKRLGRVARILLMLIPFQVQDSLGYPVPSSIGQNETIQEIRQSPTKPAGKGSKRKQDDVDWEEEQSWIEALQEELPEEAEEGDVTFEPSKSMTDTEEHRSNNDTESDLESEERGGILMLKETSETEQSKAW
uniref:Uncharacterized protein n=1 Tax=Latimeria chalumnae TaxID=7897 RepID=H3A939_LATCH